MKEIPTIPVRTIMDALVATPGGKSLDATMRWGYYRGDETDEEWRQILGVTAIDTLHSQLFTGVIRAFLIREGDRFTPQQQEIFQYGGLGHDFGEAKIDGEGVGDVPAPFKTGNDEKVESDMARRVIYSLPVPRAVQERLEYGYACVAEGLDPDLHKPFRALEKFEYLVTGLKVYQNDRKREQMGLTVATNELCLVGRSISLMGLINLLDDSLGFCPVDEYPSSIGYWLHQMAPLIDEAYSYSVDFLRTHPDNFVPDYNPLCDRFEELWEAFKARGNE